MVIDLEKYVDEKFTVLVKSVLSRVHKVSNEERAKIEHLDDILMNFEDFHAKKSH